MGEETCARSGSGDFTHPATYSWLQLLAGVTCIAAGLLSEVDSLRWLQVALALLGKFGATAR